MRISADLSKPVIVHAAKLDWVPSPAPGVDRRMLFRVGGEVARATSVVRYAPGSAFPRHTHTGGEEILVVDGTFQDEHGDYPAGSYFRNPPGTSHVPAAKGGCTIFVRLWQYREGDQDQVVCQPGQGGTGRAAHGRKRLDHPLRRRPRGGAPRRLEGRPDHHGREHARAGVLRPFGRADRWRRNVGIASWGRLPAGTHLIAAVGSEGGRVWLKDAPLLHPDALRMPE